MIRFLLRAVVLAFRALSFAIRVFSFGLLIWLGFRALANDSEAPPAPRPKRTRKRPAAETHESD